MQELILSMSALALAEGTHTMSVAAPTAVLDWVATVLWSGFPYQPGLTSLGLRSTFVVEPTFEQRPSDPSPGLDDRCVSHSAGRGCVLGRKQILRTCLCARADMQVGKVGPPSRGHPGFRGSRGEGGGDAPWSPCQGSRPGVPDAHLPPRA